MKNQITENQSMKLNKLEEDLRELWQSLTPSEQKRRVVFCKFHELQKLIQVVQNRNSILNKKEIKND